MLAGHALALVGVPMKRVIRITRDARDARYSLLRGYFHGADDDTVNELDQARLQSVTLPEAARCLGQTLDAQALHAVGVSVVSVRRAHGGGAMPRPTTCCRPATRWCCRACPNPWPWQRKSSCADDAWHASSSSPPPPAHQPCPAFVGPGLARASDGTVATLRTGGVVVALRHALAPGTFDPPEFKLGDCRTQRNLNDEGRGQAQRIGQWFRRQGLAPTRVRSSPWCRCADTATAAFGAVDAWAALGSPRGHSEQTNDAHLGQLRAAMAAVPPGRFEVWVTHAFVQQALAGTSTASAEGLVLRLDARGTVQTVARLAVA